MRIRAISAGLLAVGFAVAAAPAGADTIQSGNGAYTVSWDPAAQSTPITFATQNALSRLHLNGVFQVDPGASNVFDLFFNLTFTANPGFALDSVDIGDGPTGFHYGFRGAHEFNEHTVITPLGGGTEIVLDGPDIADHREGGGGAFEFIDFPPGRFDVPAGGFTLAMQQRIVLVDGSSWGFSSIDFDFVTKDAPVVSGVPEPATWAMLIAGFGGVGAAMRRRRALSCA